MKDINKPYLWLGSESIGLLGILVLYLNAQQYNIADLTDPQTAIVGIVSLSSIYWGGNKISESDYTHPHLIWTRVVKPGRRAGMQTLSNLGRKIPSLGFIFSFLSEGQSQQESRQVVEDFVTIAFDELAMPAKFRPSGDTMDRLADTIATGTTHPKRDGYRRIANNLFESESETTEKIRLILVFCREYTKADDTLDTGESIHDIQSGISRALSASGCDFEQWNHTAERLLSSYGNAYDAIHHDEPCSSDPLNGESKKDAKEYYGDFLEYFLPFRDRNSLSEKLVATIIDVVDRGELDQSAVAQNIEVYIEQERERIQAQQNAREAYLLVSMKAGLWDDTRQAIYDRFPNHVRFGNTNNRNDGSELPEEIRLTTDLIFTEERFNSTGAFLDEIGDIVPQEDRAGGLLSAYRLEIEEPAHLPEKEMAQRHLPADRLDTINVIEFLETGDSSRAVTEIAINNLLGRKIKVRELLAAVPVNVFVDAPPKQREMVDAAYADIKEELGVTELYDWGTFEPDDIKSLLIEYDETHGDSRIASDEDWEDIAEQMVENARQCERAARS